MNDLLFDTPWYLLIGIAVLGAVMLYYGANRGMAGLRWAGVTALGLALLLLLLSRFVETGPERVKRLTRELAAAADRRDWTAFSGYLDKDVTFLLYHGRDQLTTGAAKTMDAVGVKNVSVDSFTVEAVPGGYNVSFTAFADVAVISQRTPTNWRLVWGESPDPRGYLLFRVEKLPDLQFGTELVTSRLVPP